MVPGSAGRAPTTRQQEGCPLALSGSSCSCAEEKTNCWSAQECGGPLARSAGCPAWEALPPNEVWLPLEPCTCDNSGPSCDALLTSASLAIELSCGRREFRTLVQFYVGKWIDWGNNVRALSVSDSVLVTPMLLEQPPGHTVSPGRDTRLRSRGGVGSSEQLCGCRFCSRLFSTHVLCRAHESRQHQQHSAPTAGPVFCRYTYGLGGMPTCRLCRHLFRKWGNLAKHITRNQCPVLTGHRPLAVAAPPGLDLQASPSEEVQAPPTAEVEARVNPLESGLPGSLTTAPRAPGTTLPSAEPEEPVALPLVQRTNIPAILERSHWHDLLQLPELKEELQHRCPFCRQWCMDVAAVKRHMTQQHAEWVTAFSTVVSHLTPFQRTIVFPCRYCGQTQVNKHTHWRTRVVLQVSCYLELKHHARPDGGNPGNDRPGEALLPRSMSLFTGHGPKEGARCRDSVGCHSNLAGHES